LIEILDTGDSLMMRPLSAVVFVLLSLAGNSSEAPTTTVKPPEVTVLQNSPGQADGLIFTSAIIGSHANPLSSVSTPGKAKISMT
jgi:hypothetical protein